MLTAAGPAADRGSDGGVPVVAFAWTVLDGILLEAAQPELQFYAASTMKLAVMVEAFRQVDRGRLSLEQKLRVRADFRSVGGGEPFRLDPDDADPELAPLVGSELTLADLIERMITASSNEATNLILEAVGLERLRSTMAELGLTGSTVTRPIGDLAARSAGLTNLVTPLDLCRLLGAIAKGRAATPPSCSAMISILERQHYRDEIPAGVPAGVRTANKNGWVAGLRHDACLVWPKDSPAYCLAVCTSGFALEGEAQSAIQARSRECYARRAIIPPEGPPAA